MLLYSICHTVPGVEQRNAASLQQLPAAQQDLHKFLPWRVAAASGRWAQGAAVAAHAGWPAHSCQTEQRCALRMWRLFHAAQTRPSFLAYPMAVAVREELQRHVRGAAAPLLQAAIWLTRAPQGMHVGVWRAVCLAALLALDCSRCRMVELQCAQQQNAAANAALAVMLAPVASRVAVGHFSSMLQSFACLCSVAASSMVAQLVGDHRVFCAGGPQVAPSSGLSCIVTCYMCIC